MQVHIPYMEHMSYVSGAIIIFRGVGPFLIGAGMLRQQQKCSINVMNILPAKI